MNTGSGAGDGAARAPRASARLRVTPVTRADAERLTEVLTRLPAVEAASLEQHEGDTATYTLSAPSIARLVAELGQVAARTGAALTRTISGDVVLALPVSDSASEGVPLALAPGSNATGRQGGIAEDGIISSPDHRTRSVPPDTPKALVARAPRRLASRPRLRAVPPPDAPRLSFFPAARRRVHTWRTRISRHRRWRAWRGPLAVVALAALLALIVTFADRCALPARSAAMPPSGEGHVGAMPPATLPRTTAVFGAPVRWLAVPAVEPLSACPCPRFRPALAFW